MPKGQYGPGGKWIHDRAHRIIENMGNEYSPEKSKAVAYATATQQAHKVGKSPKDFRTSRGVHEAKVKLDKPKSEYQKTAARDILERVGDSSMIDIATINGFVDELEKIAVAKTIIDEPKVRGPLYDPEVTVRDIAAGKTKATTPGIARRGWNALGKTWHSGAGGKAAIIGIPAGLIAAGGIGGALAAKKRRAQVAPNG